MVRAANDYTNEAFEMLDNVSNHAAITDLDAFLAMDTDSSDRDLQLILQW